MLKYFTLKRKLLFSFFVVTSFSIVVTTFFSIRYFSEKINTEALENMRRGIQVAELIYENKKTEVRNIASSLASDGTLQLLVKLNSKRKIEQYLSEKVILQRKNLYVTIIPAQEKILLVHGESETTVPFIENFFKQADFFHIAEQLKTQALASTERIPRGSGLPDLLAITTVSVFSAESKLVGDSGKESFAGAVMVQSILNDDTEILHNIEKLFGVQAAIYQNYRPISSLGETAIPQDIYQRLIQGIVQYEAETQFAFGEKLAQYTALRNMNDEPVGVLGISLAADKFVSTRQRAVVTLLGIMVGCLVGASVLGYVLAKSIVEPVKNLLNGVEKITSGDLSHKLPIRSQDELGTLARAFNSMAQELKESFDTLEQRVDAATAYLTAIIDNMADGLLATDPEGRITRFNPALQAMLGIEQDDLLGKHCGEVFGREITELVELTNSGEKRFAMAEIEMANGRVGKAVATAIYKDSERPEALQQSIGTVLLTRDITREKEIDQMKTDFISTVSHELRTPLTSVLGFTKIIKKRFDKVIVPKIEQDTEKKTVRAVRQIQENLDIILTEGERLTSLINDVLDVAKMEAGKIDWRMEKLSVADIIGRAMVATSSLFAKKGLAQVKEIPQNVPDIRGDRDRLIQVVINLISNAVKFTDEGSVTCRVQRRNNELVVSVIDTGGGIADVDQPKVFEKFKQVGDTLTGKPTGTGLGLPICKQIVEHHGGRIWVESTLGEGSIFSFTLPILVEPFVSRTVTRETFLQHLQKRREREHKPDAAQRKKTILVVDDKASIRKLLRQELEPENYRICDAQSGKEAIEKAWKECPNVIILDVLMPEMAGPEVATILKSDPLSMNIPIIVLSGLKEQELGTQFGIDGYLTKPIDTHTLLQKIDEMLAMDHRQKILLVANGNLMNTETFSDGLHHEYTVLEAHTLQEVKQQALRILPSIIILDSIFAEKHDILNSIRSEQGLEHTFFLFVTKDEIDGTHTSEKTVKT